MGELNAWQTERARTNHDVLKNQLLPAIVYLIRVLEGRVGEPGYISIFTSRETERWSRLRTQLGNLFFRFEAEVSPATLFCSPPLDQVALRDRSWMAPLVHQHWWTVRGARDLVEQCRTLLSQADDAWARVLKSLDDQRAAPGPNRQDAEGMRQDSLRDGAIELYGCCSALSRAISQLPSSAKLTVEARRDRQ